MIKTTHVGSLPRPADMLTRQMKKLEVSDDDLRRYVAELIERQLALGLSCINNGELPRKDYISATIQRISGFNGHCQAPLPQDMEEIPEYARRFGGRNGLITLNPKAPIELPACSEDLSYSGEQTLRGELEMMVSAFGQIQQRFPGAESELFFTAPSPGTIALFLQNHHYPDYRTYLEKLGELLKQEYEIITSYGVIVQIDCPDLAMGRHTRFKDLDDDAFLNLIDDNIEVLNEALASIASERCRAHICWGNYPGTHHCDIELGRILPHINRLRPKYISIESCNHRHGHEWELFKEYRLADDKTLLPGVIDTTSNTVEHPDLVAGRLLNFINILGSDRVIGSTDCGFASTASATGVSGEVAWLKLKALVDGARRAAARI
jgi:5-methyltetrahydropteroyltriglutamate--homocysteine methyltransferase